jgi:hypothetical protein
MPCPTFELLIEYAEKTLSPSEYKSTADHAAHCTSCQQTLAWYRGVVETARQDETVDPPVWETRRAVGLFADAREAAARRGLRGFIARLVGALVFDSNSSLATDFVPARSSAATATRQLLFSADPFDVDLLIAGEHGAKHVAISGQVLATDIDEFEGVGGLSVELERDGKIVCAIETSEFGEFSMTNVTPGTYTLRLAGRNREIVLPEASITLE